MRTRADLESRHWQEGYCQGRNIIKDEISEKLKAVKVLDKKNKFLKYLDINRNEYVIRREKIY